MQGCRPGREPGAPGRLTSAVDAPAHSALSTLLAACGRRRDQHRGGRTAPGIPGGAGRSGGQSEHWIPRPQRRGRLVMKRDNNPAGGRCFKGTAASSFKLGGGEGPIARTLETGQRHTVRKQERDGDEDSTGERLEWDLLMHGTLVSGCFFIFIYLYFYASEGEVPSQPELSISDSGGRIYCI